MPSRFRFCFLLKLKCAGQTVHAAIRSTTTPTNLTVRAGTQVKFGCETDMDSRIRWTFNIPGQQFPRILYGGYSLVSSVEGKMKVHPTTRGNELFIRFVLVKDSGVYSCHELQNITRKVDFHLVVQGMYITRHGCYRCSSAMIPVSKQWLDVLTEMITYRELYRFLISGFISWK